MSKNITNMNKNNNRNNNNNNINNNNTKIEYISDNISNNNMNSSRGYITIEKKRNTKDNIITLEQGNIKAQYKLISDYMNKEKIDETIKNIKKNVYEYTLNNSYNGDNVSNNNRIKLNSKDNFISTNINNNDIIINSNISNKDKNDLNEKSNYLNKIQNINKSSSSNNNNNNKLNNNYLLSINKNQYKNFLDSEKEKLTIEKNSIISNNNNLIENEGKINQIKGINILKSSLNQNQNIYSNFTLIIKYRNCSICEKTLPEEKMFHAKCEKHFLCKKCIKYYLEERIEEGDKILYCPFTKCKAIFSDEFLPEILSSYHYEMYLRRDNVKPYNYALDNIKLYTKTHVLDIDTNENFFKFKKNKIQFCNKCGEPTLFNKTGTKFIKCLNCLQKICKYCIKEYDNTHLDINIKNHCKVYFRKDESKNKDDKNNDNKNNDDNNESFCFNLIKEILYIIISFFMIIIAGFIYIENFIKFLFCLNKCNNIIIDFIIVIFSFIFFLPVFLLILVSYPFFPVFIMIWDIFD